MSELVTVETPEGTGRFFVDAATQPSATVVLGHGAGGGVTARDLETLAHRLPQLGTTVIRFEQPWRTAGGRVAVRPPRLDIAWTTAVTQLPELGLLVPPVITGGRSAGARVACRTATACAVDAVLCLAFPLHLPGRPEKSRAGELALPTVPRLVLQGSRDAFGSAAEVRAAIPPEQQDEVQVIELVGADHSFRVAAGSSPTAAELLHTVVAASAALVQSLRD